MAAPTGVRGDGEREQLQGATDLSSSLYGYPCFTVPWEVSKHTHSESGLSFTDQALDRCVSEHRTEHRRGVGQAGEGASVGVLHSKVLSRNRHL